MLCRQQLLQLRLDFCVEIFVALTPMADHRRRKRAKRFLTDLDRPRNVQFNVSHKSCETFHKLMNESNSFLRLDAPLLIGLYRERLSPSEHFFGSALNDLWFL